MMLVDTLPTTPQAVAIELMRLSFEIANEAARDVIKDNCLRSRAPGESSWYLLRQDFVDLDRAVRYLALSGQVEVSAIGTGVRFLGAE